MDHQRSSTPATMELSPQATRALKQVKMVGLALGVFMAPYLGRILYGMHVLIQFYDRVSSCSMEQAIFPKVHGSRLTA